MNDRLINCQFEVVFDFGYNDSPITKVYVKLDDKNAVKEAMSKNFHVTKHKVVAIQRIDANIVLSKNSSQTFRRTQFPFTLGWTCTIHKVQGLTLLNSYVVYLELIKQRSYSPGQICVAFLVQPFSFNRKQTS